MTACELRDYWFESADSDYRTMKLLHQGKQNTWTLFMGHLVVEKLLKGLYARENSESPIAPRVHNLILLAQKTGLEIPEEMKEKIQVINAFNIAARYDDYKRTFATKCTDEWTAVQVKNIEETMEWLKRQ